MDTPILDLSFLYKVSGNDPTYILEVIDLFLESVPEKMAQLNHLIKHTDDFASIQKQAHYLKSSAHVIIIKDMPGGLDRIELLARQQTGKEEMVSIMDAIMPNFLAAVPKLHLEQEKCKRRL